MDQRTESMLQTVLGLPPHAITATLRSPRGTSTREFKGALLYDYVREVGLAPTPPSRGFGNYYFVATADDGFSIGLSYFEVTPRATDKQVLLAYEQDGEPLRVGVRLVVPGDDLGGRSIMGVVDVQLRQVDSVEPQESRPQAKVVSLGGLLERPAELTLDDLARFTQHKVETQATPRHGGVIVPPRRYAGVLLWDLLEAAGPDVDAAVHEDIMRKLVVARSTDGYAAAVAPGEIDPRFISGQVLIATSCEGCPLTESEGAFRLVVPYDRAVGRAIKCLTAIELIDA